MQDHRAKQLPVFAEMPFLPMLLWRDWPEVAEELGDLMLQPVVFAQMASEEGHFGIADSLDVIN